MKPIQKLIHAVFNSGLNSSNRQNSLNKNNFKRNRWWVLGLIPVLALVGLGISRVEKRVVAGANMHPAPADVSLTKVTGGRPLGGYRPGLQVVFQLTVANGTRCKRYDDGVMDDCAPASEVTVKDVLPGQLKFVAAEPPNVYNRSTGIWTVGKLSPGASASLVLITQINDGVEGNVTNYAQVWTQEPGDQDSTAGDNSTDEDDDATVTINVIPVKSSIAGNVYVDENDNGKRDRDEEGIGNVKLQLTGTDAQGTPISLTAATLANGSYLFSNLNQGNYKIVEMQPENYLDGRDTAGSAGGTVSNDQISNIQLGNGVNATDYNFGERAAPKASIAGNVYIDANDNGLRDQSEEGIGNVRIQLSGADTAGNSVSMTTQTLSNGVYAFTNLNAGIYRLVETQPANYLDGKDSVGSAGGILGNDQISSIPLRNNVAAVNYNFGESIPPRSSIAGNVYADSNDNGVRDSDEAGIGGVKITLVGTDNFGGAISRVLNTQSNGTYLFTNLPAGIYKLIETQPDGFVDGKDTVGSAGGALANDLISNIYLGPFVAAINYNFGERNGQVDLAITKSHAGDFTAGREESYTLKITNVGNLATHSEITVTDYLPGGMSFVSGTGTGWICGSEDDRKIICGRGASLAPGEATTISLRVDLASRMLSHVVNMAVVSTPGDAHDSNNTAKDPTNIKPAPSPAPTDPCDSNGGSVLLFPLYSSDAANSRNENTRFTLTNTNTNTKVVVHLFLVDGATCGASDAYVCLTANQTATFLASDLDPGTTGYVVAVATSDQGCPISFNHLIGQADVRLSSGHSGSYLAEKYRALYSGTLAGCDGNSTFASIGLDGVNYEAPANQVAIPVLGSLADGNNPLLVLVRTGGNLGIGASPLGSIFGVLYNDRENAFSFSFSSNACLFRQALTADFPRTAPRMNVVISAGQTGWMRLGPMGGAGVAGLLFNRNSDANNLGSIFSTGVNLPKLRCGTDSYTIPVFPPSC